MKIPRRRFLHLTAGAAALPATSHFAWAQMKAHLADLGGTVLRGSPADFGKLMAEETEKWGKVIRAAHIKAD